MGPMKKELRNNSNKDLSYSKSDEADALDFKWNAAMQRAELEYLNDMLPQLKAMADRMGERTLGYIIGLAATEAQTRLEVHKYLSEDD